ncbi:hypothetical protein BD414DRAFT_579055 [Trametes punicea]|nr:hypothetical protein BD414DRAFT_579055 [Trametes punicea]
MEEDSSGTSSSSPSPIELHPRSRSSSEQLPRKRRSKDGVFSSGSLREVAQALILHERETSNLRRAIDALRQQLRTERQRADAAEGKTREVLALFKSANEAKLAAEQKAARANETLQLYKLQYENAQQEIRKAQKLIDTLEAQRIEAEEAAVAARNMARKAKEEALILSAREAGRRQGLEEGLAQGRIIGYEEGRAAGYEDGRADTERAYTEAPLTEPYVEDTPRQRQYQPPRVSRPSTSEDSDGNIAPNYTQPMDNSLPVPPPVTTPARIPTPGAPRVDQIPKASDVRPIAVQNTMLSPSHPPMEVPPDGWIPKIDDDMRIRLPPPHEMAPPPPTPSPPLSAVLNNVKNIEEPPPVVIPPPLSSRDTRMQDTGSIGAPGRPRHRRRNSDESQSTTMSQFEILGPPSSAPSTMRGTVRERPHVLSAIAEERERTSSVSSPVYGMPNASTHSFQMPSPAPQMPTPSPNVPMPSPQPPPPNPTYPTPESMARYRSTDSLSRSSGADNKYPSSEQRSRSRAGSADEYYRGQPSNGVQRYGSADNLYRPPVPEGAPPYGRGEDRPRSPRPDERRAYASTDGGSRSGSVRGYPSRDNLTRASSRSDLGGRGSVENPPRPQNPYAPPRSPNSSPESPTPPVIVAPSPSLQPPLAQQTPSSRGSMSSNEITFNIVPPSRPESNISRIDAETPGSFLSAEDADRPLPPLPSDSAADPTDQPARPPSPVIPPAVMLSGPFPPPGFVPTGPPSPVSGGPPPIYGGSTVGPTGMPLPPSTIGGAPSVRSEVPIPGSFPGAPDGPAPVIPLQPSSRSSQSGSSRRAKDPYSRSAVTRRDADSDSSVSSGLGSSDSLTTPPQHKRKLSGRSTPSYAPAPLPPNVSYPAAPPTPRSTTSTSLGSHATRAARVPLPPSVAGSAINSVVSLPGSNSGYPTAPTPLNRRASIVGSTRPPSEAGRPRSPLMSGGRNELSPSRPPSFLPVPEPVIPIPIPEPPPPLPVAQIIPMPSTPGGRSEPLGDLEPVPIVARAPSPSPSTVTTATTATAMSTGPKGKKGKKKTKAKSRFASVEEAPED